VVAIRFFIMLVMTVEKYKNLKQLPPKKD